MYMLLSKVSLNEVPKQLKVSRVQLHPLMRDKG